MKIAVAIATADAAPSAFVVFRGIEESIEKAAKIGYDGVELALKNKEQVDVKTVKKLIDAYGLTIPTISTGQVFADLGLYFTAKDPKMQAQIVDVIKGLIETAAEVGAGLVNIGRCRGFIEEGDTYEETEKRFIDVVQRMLGEAEAHNVSIILEPVNRYEINYINTQAEGAALVRKVNHPRFGLMPDVFHMNIEDPSVSGTLARFIDITPYIHFADSNRLAPGWGHLNFMDIIDTLRAVGYDGWTSVEILPKPDPDSAAKQAIDYLRMFIPKA